VTSQAPSKKTQATRSLFPLVRHLSALLSPPLIRSPISANQITSASMLLGLGAAGLMTLGAHVYWMTQGIRVARNFHV
jgi:hypothetical protein